MFRNHTLETRIVKNKKQEKKLDDQDFNVVLDPPIAVDLLNLNFIAESQVRNLALVIGGLIVITKLSNTLGGLVQIRANSSRDVAYLTAQAKMYAQVTPAK